MVGPFFSYQKRSQHLSSDVDSQSSNLLAQPWGPQGAIRTRELLMLLSSEAGGPGLWDETLGRRAARPHGSAAANHEGWFPPEPFRIIDYGWTYTMVVFEFQRWDPTNVYKCDVQILCPHVFSFP